jgi:hypothetical protein
MIGEHYLGCKLIAAWNRFLLVFLPLQNGNMIFILFLEALKPNWKNGLNPETGLMNNSPEF